MLEQLQNILCIEINLHKPLDFLVNVLCFDYYKSTPFKLVWKYNEKFQFAVVAFQSRFP